MALKPERNTRVVNKMYTTPFQTERGGFLSLVTLSGMQYVIYDPFPNSQSIPIGIQEYDFEEVDLVRAIAPWRTRNAYPPFSICSAIQEGVVITNFIHPSVASITPGDIAYLAESGLITNVPDFGGKRVGRFMSSLNAPDLGVIGPGAVRVGGRESIVNPSRVMIPTAGWARLYIQVI